MTNAEKALQTINELVDFCNSENTSTTIANSDKTIHLVKDTVGKALYIYGECSFDNEFFVRLDNKMEIVAIVAENTVYIIDTCTFGWWEITRASAKLPECVVWFSEYQKELNDKLSNEFFKKYYENLVPTKTSQWDDDTLYRFARTDLLGGINYKRRKIEESSLLSDNSVAKILAGIISEESAFMDSLNKDASIYDYAKSRDVATAKYFNEHNVVEDYELRIAEAMRNTEAKSVTVYFEKNGKQASAKASPDSVQGVLIRRFDYFSSFDFVNSTEAKKMFTTLGVDNSCSSNSTKLFTNDIVKIMYRGKAIYERENLA